MAHGHRHLCFCSHTNLVALEQGNHFHWMVGKRKKNTISQTDAIGIGSGQKIQVWEEMQKLFYEQAARTKYGNSSSLAATTVKATGREEMIGVCFWNVYFK